MRVGAGLGRRVGRGENANVGVFVGANGVKDGASVLAKPLPLTVFSVKLFGLSCASVYIGTKVGLALGLAVGCKVGINVG